MNEQKNPLILALMHGGTVAEYYRDATAEKKQESPAKLNIEDLEVAPHPKEPPPDKSRARKIEEKLDSLIELVEEQTRQIVDLQDQVRQQQKSRQLTPTEQQMMYAQQRWAGPVFRDEYSLMPSKPKRQLDCCSICLAEGRSLQEASLCGSTPRRLIEVEE